MLSSFSFTKVAHGFHNCIYACVEPLKFASDCSLHILFNLSSGIFVDAYELSQQDGYKARLSAPMDLELPSKAIGNETTSVLISLDTSGVDNTHRLCVDIPLHYRYADPIGPGHPGSRLVDMDDPVAFWACPVQSRFQYFWLNEYTHRRLQAGVQDDWDRLGPFQSSFNQLHIISIPSSSTMPWRELPVGRTSHLYFVESITALSAFLAFLYLFHIAWVSVPSLVSRKRVE